LLPFLRIPRRERPMDEPLAIFSPIHTARLASATGGHPCLYPEGNPVEPLPSLSLPMEEDNPEPTPEPSQQAPSDPPQSGLTRTSGRAKAQACRAGGDGVPHRGVAGDSSGQCYLRGFRHSWMGVPPWWTIKQSRLV
jgi:hypothetical protein